MKKAFSWILPAITALALVFTLGFYLGRNQNVSAVQISLAESACPVSVDFAPLSQADSARVNINTADISELMTLPGIGEVFARRIIDYRDANGPYGTVEELMNVEGIGEKRMEQLLDLVTIGG